jgi:hypothetical protein
MINYFKKNIDKILSPTINGKINKTALMLLSVFLLNWMILSINAQENEKIVTGCKRINPNEPSIYIKYDGFKKEDKECAFIFLRVVNNTTLDLEFLTDGFYYRWENGKWTNCVADREEVDLYYYYDVEVEINKAMRKTLKLPNNKNPFIHEYIRYSFPHKFRDNFLSFILKAGRSFIFKVPFDYYKKGYCISVFFKFLWEQEQHNFNDKDFEIRYCWHDVPEEFKKSK